MNALDMTNSTTIPECFSWHKGSSIYNANKREARTVPCLTLFHVVKWS